MTEIPAEYTLFIVSVEDTTTFYRLVYATNGDHAIASLKNQLGYTLDNPIVMTANEVLIAPAFIEGVSLIKGIKFGFVNGAEYFAQADPFYVDLYAVDADDNILISDTDIEITLSLVSGSLTGTVTRTLNQGEASVRFTSLTADVVSAVLKADAIIESDDTLLPSRTIPIIRIDITDDTGFIDGFFGNMELEVIGQASTYTFQVIDPENLPDGVTLEDNVTGAHIFGTPTESGTFNFRVQADDTLNTGVTTTLDIEIIVAP